MRSDSEPQNPQKSLGRKDGCLKGPKAVTFFNRFFLCGSERPGLYMYLHENHPPKKLSRFVGFHMPFAPIEHLGKV